MCFRQGRLRLWLTILLIIGPLQGPGQAETSNDKAAGAATGQSGVASPHARASGPRLGEMSYSRFVDEVELGGVRSVTMAGPRVTAQLRDGGAVETYVPEADRRQLVKQLEAQDVAITARPDRSGASLAAALVWLLPIALLIAAWIFVMRQMQGAGSGAKPSPNNIAQ